MAEMALLVGLHYASIVTRASTAFDNDASNCKRLQSLPGLPSCVQGLDASILQTPSNHTRVTLSNRMFPAKLTFAILPETE